MARLHLPLPDGPKLKHGRLMPETPPPPEFATPEKEITASDILRKARRRKGRRR